MIETHTPLSRLLRHVPREMVSAIQKSRYYDADTDALIVISGEETNKNQNVKKCRRILESLLVDIARNIVREKDMKEAKEHAYVYDDLKIRAGSAPC